VVHDIIVVSLDGAAMFYGFLLFVHLAGVVVWIGGMFFATVCLHPSLAALGGKERAALMAGTLGRFLGYVIVAIALIWISGIALVTQAGLEELPLGWHLMIGIGLLMTLIFAYLYLRLFLPARRAIAAGEMVRVPALMGRIRTLVIANLILGTLAVAAVTMVV
jgi:uncharacterized membrane protein